jgi:hypothetical protein
MRSLAQTASVRARAHPHRCDAREVRGVPRTSHVRGTRKRMPPRQHDEVTSTSRASARSSCVLLRRRRVTALPLGPDQDGTVRLSPCPPARKKSVPPPLPPRDGQSHPGPALRHNECIGRSEGSRERTRPAPDLERSRSFAERSHDCSIPRASGSARDCPAPEVKEEARALFACRGTRSETDSPGLVRPQRQPASLSDMQTRSATSPPGRDGPSPILERRGDYASPSSAIARSRLSRARCSSASWKGAVA